MTQTAFDEGDWWQAVFTKREGMAMNARFLEILEEHESPDPYQFPIAVPPSLSREIIVGFCKELKGEELSDEERWAVDTVKELVIDGVYDRWYNDPLNAYSDDVRDIEEAWHYVIFGDEDDETIQTTKKESSKMSKSAVVNTKENAPQYRHRNLIIQVLSVLQIVTMVYLEFSW